MKDGKQKKEETTRQKRRNVTKRITLANKPLRMGSKYSGERVDVNDVLIFREIPFLSPDGKRINLLRVYKVRVDPSTDSVGEILYDVADLLKVLGIPMGYNEVLDILYEKNVLVNETNKEHFKNLVRCIQLPIKQNGKGKAKGCTPISAVTEVGLKVIAKTFLPRTYGIKDINKFNAFFGYDNMKSWLLGMDKVLLGLYFKDEGAYYSELKKMDETTEREMDPNDQGHNNFKGLLDLTSKYVQFVKTGKTRKKKTKTPPVKPPADEVVVEEEKSLRDLILIVIKKLDEVLEEIRKS